MSLSKNKIKLYRSLQQKKYREKEQLFIIEGKKMVLEAIRESSHLILDVICTNSSLHLLPDDWKKKALCTDINTIKQISSLTTPQEFIAVIRKPEFQLIPASEINDLTILLDDISDPGNLGTIIRLADWFGIKSIICSENSVDCYNPKAVQATMGSIFRVNTHYTDLMEYIKQANGINLPVFGTSLNGDNLYQNELPQNALLIMGSESNGLSKEIQAIVNKNLFIPSYTQGDETGESLNISTATAITISEFRRQQFYSK